MNSSSIWPYLLLIIVVVGRAKPDSVLPASDDLVASQPNILLLVGDSFGYNDVSWNNPEILTPNLESLGRTGVIFDSYYSAPRLGSHKTIEKNRMA